MVFFTSNGAVAQMGERVTGSHKVRGSIPLSSTNDIKGLANRGWSLFCWEAELNRNVAIH
jgi:hypothetical protein